VVPVLIAVVILLFPAVLRPILDNAFPPADMMKGTSGSPYAFLTVIFTHGFAEMVLFGIPVVLGLVWNKWAGGCAGFITGTIYYLAYAGYNIMFSYLNYGIWSNLYRDPSFIGNYILGGILIGYIAGALNNGSSNFKRMLGAGLTAGLTVGVMQFVLNVTVSLSAYMSLGDPFQAFYLVVLPMGLLGVIGPIIAKVMTWYGLQPSRH
jgi:hypothetical protein